ncbi:class I glutamine amidotransferase-like protein [Penicillium atrosanguineum]|nr:class I glutamine amidotransferase-like protein [Penicillium atrosanguineum]
MTDLQPLDNPVRIGVLLFPGFQALDAFGPLDCINILSRTSNTQYQQNTPKTPGTTGQEVVPTHTYEAPPPLDVLLIPGGRGSRGSGPIVLAAIRFIKDTYPSLKYLITVCTGSGLAARAGVLDGKRATTNKMAWKDMVALGPEVEWIPHARWVTDGNIWTSSGVSAGIDVTLAWIGRVFGEEKAKMIAEGIEYTRHEDPNYDPFAELYGL